MNEIEFESAPEQSHPRTATIVALLAVTSAIFSYLGTFALTNALVAAEVLKPWPRDQDPRLKWFLIGFAVLISAFLGIAGAARRLSARNLRQFEEMESEDDKVGPGEFQIPNAK